MFFNLLEVPVFKFNDVLAELLLLNFVEDTQLPLFVPPVVKELFDGNVPVGFIHWQLQVSSFVDRAECAFACFFDDVVPLTELDVCSLLACLLRQNIVL